jgi:hypothetical protein
MSECCFPLKTGGSKPNQIKKGSSMKKRAKWIGIIVGIVGVTTAITVFAANVHLKGRPTFTDNGTTASVCATLTGLGNQDLTITLIGQGTETVACTNPAGNFAPGNPGSVTVGGQTTIPSSEIKNGTVTFCVTTTAPTCQSAKQCGCPNNNWTGTVTDVNFTDLALVVEQGGSVVLIEDVR